ncbi:MULTISPECIES: lasso peptide biosynthesis B2 protein [unclassified Novosphingobium]|nr:MULTISPECIES: lasso peptide biosynthesis B2 protein [unclassified Novosphingobium]
MLAQTKLSSSDQDELRIYVECGIVVEGNVKRPDRPPCNDDLEVLTLQETRPTANFVVHAILGRQRSRVELKFRPLWRVLSGIERSKERCSGNGSVEALHRVASGFQGISGLFGRHDQCLPLSIAIVRECLRNGLSAKMVLGVQTNPFNAHAWVQFGNILLIDDPNFVKDFTPILAV